MVAIRNVWVAAVSLIALVAAGCASGNGGNGNDAVASGGMMCPKCETFWISKLVGQGTKVQRLAYHRKMTLPEAM